MGLGITSVLTVFVALCVTIFAALSFFSARVDRNLTEKTAESVTEYYAADSKAMQTVAALSSALQNGTALPQEFTRSDTAGETLYTADFPIRENRTLHIELAQENGALVRRAWQTVTAPVMEESTLPVLQAPPTTENGGN